MFHDCYALDVTHLPHVAPQGYLRLVARQISPSRPKILNLTDVCWLAILGFVGLQFNYLTKSVS